MSKLQDMFTQARRAQSGGNIGFLGKSKNEARPRSAAIVVEFANVDAGSAEAALKAGADGLLFTWDGKDTTSLETLKESIDATKGSSENVVYGLRITGGWNKLERQSLEQLKDQGLNYVVLPLQAPARFLASNIKDVDLVVTIPMREGEMYPIFIRNLTAFESIAAVLLDFGLAHGVGTMSIEDVIQYRAVREAVRFPAMINITGDLSEADAYTLTALGVQALVLTASATMDATKQQIKSVRELLEKVHQDEKDKSGHVKL